MSPCWERVSITYTSALWLITFNNVALSTYKKWSQPNTLFCKYIAHRNLVVRHYDSQWEKHRWQCDREVAWTIPGPWNWSSLMELSPYWLYIFRLVLFLTVTCQYVFHEKKAYSYFTTWSLVTSHNSQLQPEYLVCRALNKCCLTPYRSMCVCLCVSPRCVSALCRSVSLTRLSMQRFCVSASPPGTVTVRWSIRWRTRAVQEVHTVRRGIFILGKSACVASRITTQKYTLAHTHTHITRHSL